MTLLLLISYLFMAIAVGQVIRRYVKIVPQQSISKDESSVEPTSQPVQNPSQNPNQTSSLTKQPINARSSYSHNEPKEKDSQDKKRKKDPHPLREAMKWSQVFGRPKGW